MAKSITSSIQIIEVELSAKKLFCTFPVTPKSILAEVFEVCKQLEIREIEFLVKKTVTFCVYH